MNVLLPNFVEEINSIDEKIALIDLVWAAADAARAHNLISDMSSCCCYPIWRGLIKRALMEGVNIDKHDIKQTVLLHTYSIANVLIPLTTIWNS